MSSEALTPGTEAAESAKPAEPASSIFTSTVTITSDPDSLEANRSNDGSDNGEEERLLEPEIAQQLTSGSQIERHAFSVLDPSDWYYTWMRNFLSMGFYIDRFQQEDIGYATGENIGSSFALGFGTLFIFWEFYWHIRYANIRSTQNIQRLLLEEEKSTEENLRRLVSDINDESQWQLVMHERKKWLFFGEKTNELLLYQKKEKESEESEKESSMPYWMCRVDYVSARFSGAFFGLGVYWARDYRFGLSDIYKWLYYEFTNGWYWIIWIALVFAASFAIASLPWAVIAALGCMLLSKIIVHGFKHVVGKSDTEVIPINDCNAHAAFTLRWIYIEEALLSQSVLREDVSSEHDPRDKKIIAAYKKLEDTIKDLEAACENSSIARNELWALSRLKNIASISTFLHWYMGLNFIPWAVGAVVLAIAHLAGLLAIGSIFTVASPVLVGLVVGLFVASVLIAAYQAIKVRATIEDEYAADFTLIKKRQDSIVELSGLIERNRVLELEIIAVNIRPCTYIAATNYGDLTGLEQMLDPDDYEFFSLRMVKQFICQAGTGGFIVRIAVGGLMPITAVGVSELAGVGFFAVVFSIPAIGWGIAAAILIGAIIYGAVRAVHFYQARKAELAHNTLLELDMHLHLQQYKNDKLEAQAGLLRTLSNAPLLADADATPVSTAASETTIASHPGTKLEAQVGPLRTLSNAPSLADADATPVSTAASETTIASHPSTFYRATVPPPPPSNSSADNKDTRPLFVAR